MVYLKKVRFTIFHFGWYIHTAHYSASPFSRTKNHVFFACQYHIFNLIISSKAVSSAGVSIHVINI
ncbi:Aldehyde dehydrogenase family 7 member B4 [Zea mays]|uniref:Aldehyde dehydrogenase family 7 member B4 n=1 Tax=Zea mays TaxID=4577 RepID=A0A1D6ECT2_MAIZE|nr:Aldehyde dehydrogenase family 7 member B4 [Zea mays]